MRSPLFRESELVTMREKSRPGRVVVQHRPRRKASATLSEQTSMHWQWAFKHHARGREGVGRGPLFNRTRAKQNHTVAMRGFCQRSPIRGVLGINIRRHVLFHLEATQQGCYYRLSIKLSFTRLPPPRRVGLAVLSLLRWPPLPWPSLPPHEPPSLPPPSSSPPLLPAVWLPLL